MKRHVCAHLWTYPPVYLSCSWPGTMPPPVFANISFTCRKGGPLPIAQSVQIWRKVRGELHDWPKPMYLPNNLLILFGLGAGTLSKQIWEMHNNRQIGVGKWSEPDCCLRWRTFSLLLAGSVRYLRKRTGSFHLPNYFLVLPGPVKSLACVTGLEICVREWFRHLRVGLSSSISELQGATSDSCWICRRLWYVMLLSAYLRWKNRVAIPPPLGTLKLIRAMRLLFLRISKWAISGRKWLVECGKRTEALSILPVGCWRPGSV